MNLPVRNEEIRIELQDVVHLRRISTAFPAHFHGCYVFGFAAGGSSVMSRAGENHELRCGTGLVLNPGETHRCAQIGDLDYFSVHVPVQTMYELSEALGFGQTLPHFDAASVKPQAADCLASALMEDRGKKVKLAPFLQFLELAWPRFDMTERGASASKAVEAASEIMDSEYAQPLTLPWIARRCAVSESTLLRGFSQTYGITPHGYLLSVRIDRARELLSEGRSPAEAALCTGFCDQSHLTNVFRKYIGLTPGAYPRQPGERRLAPLISYER